MYVEDNIKTSVTDAEHRLRQKVEKDAASPAILVTEAGGYKLVP